MLLHWKISCMPCYVLDQIFIIQLAWSADINQIQDLKHWQVVKYILKYLRRTRDYMLVYHSEDLIPIGYTDLDFQLNLDFRKSTSSCVFTLGGGAISWRSVKKSCITDSTMEAKYVATCEAAKEAIWLKKFLSNLGVVNMEQVPITLFCDNNGALAQSKDPRNHKK